MNFILTLFVLFANVQPAEACTPTTAAIRLIQPSHTVLPDSDLVYLAKYIDQASLESDVDTGLLITVLYDESRFQPDIINLMQISETWYKNPNVPYYCQMARRYQKSSIRCGAYVLARCSERFKDDRLLLCWRGFHIENKDLYVRRMKAKWKQLQ